MSGIRRPNSLRFPWEQWLLSPHPIEAVQGRDFPQSVRGFVSMLKRQANRISGIEVEIRARRSSNKVWFLFKTRGK